MSTTTPRVSNSEIIRRLLERGSTEHSSVTITRNAKGETQLEVIVRTGEAGEATTVAGAEQLAAGVYDRLREKYPYGAEPQSA